MHVHIGVSSPTNSFIIFLFKKKKRKEKIDRSRETSGELELLHKKEVYKIWVQERKKLGGDKDEQSSKIHSTFETSILWSIYG